MTKTFFLLLTLLATVSANAAVVDHFNCKITAVTHDGTPLYSSEMDSYASRMAFQLTPDPTGWRSFGRVELKAAGSKSDHAELHLRYQHAVQNGPDGKPVRARQALCMAVSAVVAGNGTATACTSPSPDAFASDAYGWDDTDLKNGIPVLNVQNLRPETVPFPDGSKVHFSCDHLGTEQ